MIGGFRGRDQSRHKLLAPRPPIMGEEDDLKSPKIGGFRGRVRSRHKLLAPQPPIMGEKDNLKSPKIGGFRGRVRRRCEVSFTVNCASKSRKSQKFVKSPLLRKFNNGLRWFHAIFMKFGNQHSGCLHLCCLCVLLQRHLDVPI